MSQRPNHRSIAPSPAHGASRPLSGNSCFQGPISSFFGAVMAALPGFAAIQAALQAIPNPLVNEAITVTTLAGVTGSASGGLSLALAAMAEQFKAAALVANIPPEVLHRVAAMAAGGMDTLPHNGAIITLLAITGLTHRQSYGDIFAITCIKTSAVFFVIAVYYLTGIV